MLVQFSVGNYLSFKDRVTLSLVASSDTEHEENTFETPGRRPLRLLRSVGIYGANASGKSNLLRALAFFENLIVRSAAAKNRDGTGVTPFKLDPKSTQEPSEFEVVFVQGEERYVYGFTADSARIHEEWLTAARLDADVVRQRLLFRRHPDNTIEFGASWRGGRRTLARVIVGRPNCLLLTLAAQVAGDTGAEATATPVVEWFRHYLRGISDEPEMGSEMDFTVDLVKMKEATEEQVVEFLRAADTGVDGLSVDMVPVQDAYPFRLVPEAQRTAALSLLKLKPGEEVPKVKTAHRRADGTTVEFELETEESAGTKRLLCLFGPWTYLLSLGCVVHIDELDRKLHPLIARHLLQLVHNSQKPAQLIFTTHDCTLLDPDLVRRDQVWFTEKDSTGATDLYSLWDYKMDKKVRKDENYRKGYLAGRYGAIPFVGEFKF